MKNRVQYTAHNDSLVFWAIIRGIKVELLQARPVDAHDMFRFHAIARENLADLENTLRKAA